MKKLVAVLLAALLAPAAAHAAEAAEAGKVEEKKDEAKKDDAKADEKKKSPFGLSLGLEQGFGLQTDEDTTSATLTFVIAPTYTIVDKLVLTLSLAPYIEETAEPGDGKRADFSPGGTFVRLSHGSIYKEKFTELNLSAGLTFSLPFTRDDIYNPRYPTTSASIAIDRSFGNFNARYAFGYTHFFPSSETGEIDYVDYGDGASPRPAEYSTLGYQAFNRLSHSFAVRYTFFEKLTLASSFALLHTNTFGPGETNPEIVGGTLTQGANDKYAFSFGAGVDYAITDTYSASLGFSNGGLQRPTGQEFGGPGSESVVGGPLAFIFNEQAAAVSIGVGASF